jgi:uncharacterized protein (DUF3084 family)
MTKEEIQKAKRIVLTYRELDSKIGNLNDQLKALNEKKDSLVAELSKTEMEESAFVMELEKKYGTVDYNEIAREIEK